MGFSIKVNSFSQTYRETKLAADKMPRALSIATAAGTAVLAVMLIGGPIAAAPALLMQGKILMTLVVVPLLAWFGGSFAAMSAGAAASAFKRTAAVEPVMTAVPESNSGLDVKPAKSSFKKRAKPERKPVADITLIPPGCC